MYVLIVIISLVIQIIFSIKFGQLAEAKGYSAASYGWLCFFFGIIGYCVVAALPDMRMQSALHAMACKIDLIKTNVQEEHTQIPTPPMQATKSQKPEVSEAALSPVTAADGEIFCPICNTKQAANRSVCWKCGQKFITT